MKMSKVFSGIAKGVGTIVLLGAALLTIELVASSTNAPLIGRKSHV